MAKSNGIKSLKQAAKLLNKHSPDGESLAYINPAEARLLKSHGGSGIMTLSGVPSYEDPWWKQVWTNYVEPAAKWLGYTGDEGGGKLLKDFTSLGGGALGWLESAELSDWQKKQFEEQKAKEIMNELRFAKQTDSGKQLLTQQNVPSTIEDVSRFTEVDIPTMKTTAAQGGRIGYGHGDIVEEGDINPSTIENVNDRLDAYIEIVGPEFGSINQLAKAYGDSEMVGFLLKFNQPELKLPMGAAQGGRIGAFNGGIQGLMPQQGFMPQQGMPQPGLNPRMGYAFGEEVEQVTEEVTPFSKIPENIKTADLDDIPDWWLTDFERLIEDFKMDNNGQNPTSINQLEKWYRFKHGTSQGPNIEEGLNIAAAPEIENRNEQSAEIFKLMQGAAQGGRIGAADGHPVI